MGNCSHKGVVRNVDVPIRIMTDSGEVLNFKAPKLVQDIILNHPGHGVYPKGQLSSPLLHHEQLYNGESYYLLPLKEETNVESRNQVSPRLSSSGKKSDGTKNIKITEPALEVLPSSGNGVWKMKLVIDTKQLEEILSEQVNIEALIEKMRTMAKSEISTPRRSKMFPLWGVGWRPSISAVVKLSPSSRGDLK